jgi:hypothetical protein
MGEQHYYSLPLKEPSVFISGEYPILLIILPLFVSIWKTYQNLKSDEDYPRFSTYEKEQNPSVHYQLLTMHTLVKCRNNNNPKWEKGIKGLNKKGEGISK